MPGLNRVYWDLTFPPIVPKEGITQSLQTITQLQDIVPTQAEREELAALYDSYVALIDQYREKQYRTLWKKLSEGYGRYGLPVGERARERKATPGHYEVNVTYQNQTVSGILAVRDDPLVKAN